MNDELTKRADILAFWLVDQTKKDGFAFVKSIKEGKFDLADHKVTFQEELPGKISHEFLFIYLHLIDLYVFEMLIEGREEFRNQIIRKVTEILGVDMDVFITIYNGRIQEHSKYKKMIDGQNESMDGTLLWEYAKRMAKVIDDSTPLNIAFVTNLVITHTLGELWELELLHTRKVADHIPTKA